MLWFLRLKRNRALSRAKPVTTASSEIIIIYKIRNFRGEQSVVCLKAKLKAQKWLCRANWPWWTFYKVRTLPVRWFKPSSEAKMTSENSLKIINFMTCSDISWIPFSLEAAMMMQKLFLVPHGDSGHWTEQKKIREDVGEWKMALLFQDQMDASNMTNKKWLTGAEKWPQVLTFFYHP